MIQIRAAIAAIRNIHGLPSAQDFQGHGTVRDLFDCLHYWFGFQVIYPWFFLSLPFLILLHMVSFPWRLQIGNSWHCLFPKLPTFKAEILLISLLCLDQKDNAANQKEHLILLLANMHIRHTHDQASNSKVFFSLIFNFGFTLSFTL